MAGQFFLGKCTLKNLTSAEIFYKKQQWMIGNAKRIINLRLYDITLLFISDFTPPYFSGRCEVRIFSRRATVTIITTQFCNAYHPFSVTKTLLHSLVVVLYHIRTITKILSRPKLEAIASACHRFPINFCIETWVAVGAVLTIRQKMYG